MAHPLLVLSIAFGLGLVADAQPLAPALSARLVADGLYTWSTQLDVTPAGSSAIELLLSAQALTGTIPGVALTALTPLTKLDLENNKLTGTIPPELAQLAALRWLSLRTNKLHGSLPCELDALPFAHFSLYNAGALCRDPYQTPCVDRVLARCASTAGLYCRVADVHCMPDNETPYGSMSFEARMEAYGFWDTAGQTATPAGKALALLDINLQALTSTLPGVLIGQLTSLTAFTAQSSTMTGSVPSELGTLPLLKRVDLRSSKFTGPIPCSLDARSLDYLDLYSTPKLCRDPYDVECADRLTALCPTSVGLYCNVYPHCQPSGAQYVPQPFAERITAYGYFEQGTGASSGQLVVSAAGKALDTLNVDHQYLYSSLPGALLAGMTSLTKLDVSYNKLTSSIPSELGLMTQLAWLSFRGNPATLTGPIPCTLDLRSWALLDMYSTPGLCRDPFDVACADRVEARCPQTVGINCYHTAHCMPDGSHYPQMAFTGRMDSQGWWDSQAAAEQVTPLGRALQACDLAGQQLFASVPGPLLAQMTALTLFDVASNKLTGRVPTEFAFLTNLRRLDLSSNLFTGPIPCVLDTLGLTFFLMRTTDGLCRDPADDACAARLITKCGQLGGLSCPHNTVCPPATYCDSWSCAGPSSAIPNASTVECPVTARPQTDAADWQCTNAACCVRRCNTHACQGANMVPLAGSQAIDCVDLVCDDATCCQYQAPVLRCNTWTCQGANKVLLSLPQTIECVGSCDDNSCCVDGGGGGGDATAATGGIDPNAVTAGVLVVFVVGIIAAVIVRDKLKVAQHASARKKAHVELEKDLALSKSRGSQFSNSRRRSISGRKSATATSLKLPYKCGGCGGALDKAMGVKPNGCPICLSTDVNSVDGEAEE